jgi:hypothetical protein
MALDAKNIILLFLMCATNKIFNFSSYHKFNLVYNM